MRPWMSLKTSREIGRLTSPHQMSCSEDGSRTMYLSLGERPVWAPVIAIRAPPSAI